MGYGRWPSLVAAILATACARHTGQIEPADAPSGTYVEWSCDEIALEAERISLVSRKLAAHVDGAAAADDAQTAVGLILFWPALFLLEGEETAFTREYARLKGRFVALGETSRAKGCGLRFSEVRASGASE